MDRLSKCKQDWLENGEPLYCSSKFLFILFNQVPSTCLLCLPVFVSVNSLLLMAACLTLLVCVCVCVYLYSSSALQHHDHHLDLHGPGVRPGHLSGHHHLQETARLHFTTLPIAAVCGTLSYTTLSCLYLCNVACGQTPPFPPFVCTVFHLPYVVFAASKNESKVEMWVKER